MCLIIQRKPKFEIPFDKFETAILNNQDGYGYSYPEEDGKLHTFRSAETPDPEALYRIVNEDLIEKSVMLHLRYTTAGETILRNAHPFPILEKDVDGIDLRMAHNGTLHKYKPVGNSSESDTRNFVKTFVRPLFKRLGKGMSTKELLTDPFTQDLLEDQLTAMSVLTFIDGEGNSLICNAEGNGGKEEEDWYYSNTYSFDPTHRLPAPRKTHYLTPPNNSSLSPSKGFQLFSERNGMKDIRQAQHFSNDTIETISKDPHEAKLLIAELILELSRSKRKEAK